VREWTIVVSCVWTGGIYDSAFLAAVQPLYDMHMGVENMGPLLYSLIRFHKPRHVLEVGAGYERNPLLCCCVP
jgi:hypothetical protein